MIPTKVIIALNRILGREVLGMVLWQGWVKGKHHFGKKHKLTAIKES